MGTESEMSYLDLFKICIIFDTHDLLFSADYLHYTLLFQSLES